MKLVELKPDADRSAQCRKAAEDFMTTYGDNCQVVVILGIDNDGKQFMMSNPSSHYEKSFIFAFFQALVISWFHVEVSK